MTERLYPTPDGYARAADLLARGRVIAFPTDTVYGVGVAASRADALPKLFELKRRPPDRAIPMLCVDLAQVREGGWIVDSLAERLAARFWPGPLTLVLSSADGATTQGFRAPDHPVALELIRTSGPLLATSANISGEPETFGADEVLIAFATQQDDLAAVVDGGYVPGGIASTVLDLSVSPPTVVRAGPITAEQLEAVFHHG